MKVPVRVYASERLAPSAQTIAALKQIASLELARFEYANDRCLPMLICGTAFEDPALSPL